jgi:DNA-binding HxlR family transcriptional regulator
MSYDTRSDEGAVDPRPLVDTNEVLLSAQEVFGRKWTPIILHRLLVEGPLRFNDLQRSVGDVSGKVLSESLDHLEEVGVVDRRTVGDGPVQVEYATTERGEALAPAVSSLVAWGREHVADAERAVAGPSRN